MGSNFPGRTCRRQLFASVLLFSSALLLPSTYVAAPSAAQEVQEEGGPPAAAAEAAPDRPEREEALIGPNRQPEWTTRRRFSLTRIYVLPPWELDLYTTWRIRRLRPKEEEEDEDEEPEGEPGEEPREVQNLLSQEFELGLPYRFQVEYQVSGSNDFGDWQLDNQSVELRWAVAEWGAVPLNPTLVAEWKFRNGVADAYETKVLVGDEIASRWHAGANLFFEQQVGDQREQEIAATFALSYTVLDEFLGLGVEAELAGEREAAEEGADFEFRGLLGPSLQWSPLKNMFVDVVPLFGLSDKSPVIESFVVLGFNFNTPPEEEGLEPRPPVLTH